MEDRRQNSFEFSAVDDYDAALVSIEAVLSSGSELDVYGLELDEARLIISGLVAQMGRAKELTSDLVQSLIEENEYNLRDEGTGLYTRRVISKYIWPYLENVKGAIPHWFCYIDIIDLSGVNNDKELGHSYGDKLILSTAQSVCESVRGDNLGNIIDTSSQYRDIVMRLGGDEIGIFGAGDIEAANVVSERIMKNHTISMSQSDLPENARRGIRVSTAQLPDASKEGLSVAMDLADPKKFKK